MTFSSCQSKIEKFNADYDSFKTKNSESLKTNLEKLIAFKDAKIDENVKDKKDKSIKLNLVAKEFNALVLNKSYLDELSGDENATDLSNAFLENDNLLFLSRMLKGKEDEIRFIKSIRKEGFSFDEFSQPMMSYNKFLDFCKRFNNLEYAIINYPTKIIEPELSSQGFYKGEYSGTITIFDFKSNKMIGAFDYFATNSDYVYESNTIQGDTQALYKDFNDEILRTIERILIVENYTRGHYGSSDLDGMEFVKYKSEN